MEKTVLNAPSYEVYEFFPKDFFDKKSDENAKEYEKFTKFIMEHLLPSGKWVRGDETKQEPDYFYNNIPFEFTLASDKKGKSNFIFRLKTANYTTNNVEKDAFNYIEQQIEVKSKKEYLISNTKTKVYLCVLCLLDRFEWVSDLYGSRTHFITDVPREEFFNKIKKEYLETKKFKGIYIIFPDISASWWVWDLNTENRAKIQLLPMFDDLGNYPYPYIIEKELYEKFKVKISNQQ